jgi:hypothetical protein
VNDHSQPPRPEGRAEAWLTLAALAAGLALALVLAATLKLPQALMAAAFPPGADHRLDGTVSPGEYAFGWTDQASGLAFYWSIMGDRLIGAVASPDTGWVAVGFGGEGPLMMGADIVMGAVEGGAARVNDHYADSPTDQKPDPALGAGDDILGAAGTEGPAGTTIEFVRPLAARDSADRPVVTADSAPTHVILASAESDDFTAYHSGGRKAVASLDLRNGPPPGASASLLPEALTDVQIMLATWMTVFLLVGLHGVLGSWASRGFSAPAAAAEAGNLTTLLIAAALLLELAALVAFGAGVAFSAPTWALGLSLALGLAALAAIIALYGRAFVRWELASSERDDGIPW